MISEKANLIFNRSIQDYHIYNDVNLPMNNPYEPETIEHLLYEKNWIDTVQWHLEDIIREPNIDPTEALEIKRRIDSSNQNRTDLVEEIDDYFYKKYRSVQVKPNATINTESPAWAIDRLSILALKIYHMKEEAKRENATEEHRSKANQKLAVLLQQQIDLSTAIDQLLQDMEQGNKYMKVYKQMKMYNDPSMNPVLYAKNNE